MHTLPILAEYLMSWSCSLWRFKFTIGLLSAQWLDGLKWGNTGDLAWPSSTVHTLVPEQGPVESGANCNRCHDLSFWSYRQLDNFSIVHDQPWGCCAVRNCKLFYILSSGLHYGWIGHHYTYDDWQVNISEYKISIFCLRVSLTAITLLLDKEARTELIRT